jgi:hypothetical protein
MLSRVGFNELFGSDPILPERAAIRSATAPNLGDNGSGALSRHPTLKQREAEQHTSIAALIGKTGA